eukprot:7147026-Prymnesium_polylepis.1
MWATKGTSEQRVTALCLGRLYLKRTARVAQSSRAVGAWRRADTGDTIIASGDGAGPTKTEKSAGDGGRRCSMPRKECSGRRPVGRSESRSIVC